MAYETITTIANTAARPGSPTDGMIRYQQDLQVCIVYDSGASAWKVFTPDQAPYDLDGTNIMSVSPNFHFDAEKINGVDGTGNPSDATAFSGAWTSRTNAMTTIPQSTAGSQPTYNTTGTNSKAYLAFDGGDYLPITPYTDKYVATGDFTIFAVAEKTADASGYFSFACNVGSNLVTFMNFSTGTDYLFFGSTGYSNAKARPDIDGSEATYATTRMFLVIRDASNNGDLFVDGDNQNTLLASTTTSEVLAASGTVCKSPLLSNGTQGLGKSTYATTGDIYEVAFWDSDLSAADRNKLISYVNTKYGVGRNADDSGTFARVTF